jgi:nucleotide-binding universal stress UspA family protein
MIQSILVPLDGSRFAERALPTAVALAQRTGARLLLTRVHVPLPFEAFPASHGAMEADIHFADGAYMQEWVQRLASRRIQAEGVVLCGSVPFALRVAARTCADPVVVMASHRRRPAARALYGSIADSLIRRSGTPVLLVGDTARTGAAIRRVLVPLDGSSAAERVALPAFDVAGPVEYVLVHVRHHRPEESGITPPVDAAVHASIRRIRPLLDGLGAHTTVRLGRGRVAETIASIARPGDLVAMTTRHGTVGSLLFGSTADQVMRAAPDVAALIFQPGGRRNSAAWGLPAARTRRPPDYAKTNGWRTVPAGAVRGSGWGRTEP